MRVCQPERRVTQRPEKVGISGSNIVGEYGDGSTAHDFFYNGTTWATLDYPEAIHTYVTGISGSNIGLSRIFLRAKDEEDQQLERFRTSRNDRWPPAIVRLTSVIKSHLEL